MRYILTLAILLISGQAFPADTLPIKLVQPKGTELVLKKLVRKGDLSASFVGQIWVVGTVVGRWTSGATNLSDSEPEFLLVPSPKSIAQLPYFVLQDPPYFNQYKVQSISLANGPDALRIAAGKEKLRRLLERRVNHVRVTGRFLIEQYVVGVECDAPWARATLVQAEVPEKMAQHSAVPEGC